MGEILTCTNPQMPRYAQYHCFVRITSPSINNNDFQRSKDVRLLPAYDCHSERRSQLEIFKLYLYFLFSIN